MRVGGVRQRAWRGLEVSRRSQALSRPCTSPPAHAALAARPSTQCNSHPRPVCVQRWRWQAVERIPSAAVVPAYEGSAIYISRRVREQARAACALSVGARVQPPRLCVRCPGRSRWAAQARALRAPRGRAHMLATGSICSTHGTGGLTRVHTSCACRCTIIAPAENYLGWSARQALMQRQASAGRRACRLQCMRHVRRRVRPGWRVEPRLRVARAQVICRVRTVLVDAVI